MAKTLPVWQQIALGLLFAGALFTFCKRDEPREQTKVAPAQEQVPPPPPPQAPESPAPPAATPAATPMTVLAFKAADKEAQVLAVRDRWNQNAAEPTLGKLVSAARAANTEIDAVAGIYECTTRVVNENKETMKVFKELDITDAHTLAEPGRSLTDAIDMCMVMVIALSQD